MIIEKITSHKGRFLRAVPLVIKVGDPGLASRTKVWNPNFMAISYVTEFDESTSLTFKAEIYQIPIYEDPEVLTPII